MINLEWEAGGCSSGSKTLTVTENDRLLGQSVRSVGSIIAVSSPAPTYAINIDLSGKFSIDASGMFSRLHLSISNYFMSDVYRISITPLFI